MFQGNQGTGSLCYLQRSLSTQAGAGGFGLPGGVFRPEVGETASGPRSGQGNETEGVELAGVSRALTDLEGQFLQHLDLLKRDVLSETEFRKANEVARTQSTALETRRDELAQWLEEQRTRVSTAALPRADLS